MRERRNHRRNVLSVFQETRAPTSDGVKNLNSSLTRVLDSKTRHMAISTYDVQRPTGSSKSAIVRVEYAILDQQEKFSISSTARTT